MAYFVQYRLPGTALFSAVVPSLRHHLSKHPGITYFVKVELPPDEAQDDLRTLIRRYGATDANL